MYLPIIFPFCLLYALFPLFVLVTVDVVYVSSVRFKHTDSSCGFLGSNYRGYNLNILILKQLLITGDIKSNPGPTQNDYKSPVGQPKKIKVFKGIAKKCDLSENNVNLGIGPKV